MKQHLSLLINRVIFRYRLTDLFYGEIEKYPFSYQIASECIQALEAILQHKISKVEISYLTLYLELAFRYQKSIFPLKSSHCSYDRKRNSINDPKTNQKDIGEGYTNNTCFRRTI